MRGLLLMLGIVVALSCAAEEEKESDFQINFNIAKQHLSQRRILKALPYLQYLLEKHPNNANLKYLIGVCYTEAEIIHPSTLELLEEATSFASLEYNPNSLDETRTPIYSFYYLSVAYAQHKQCDKAAELRNRFLEIYPHEDEYYVEESKSWIKRCRKDTEVPVQKVLPQFPEFKPYVSRRKKPKKETLMVENSEQLTKPEEPIVKLQKKTVETEEKEILTKRVEYTTNQPLYGVQLGAFKEAVPVSRFKKLKNVDAFMDKDGLIRYVIGHFSIHSQAMSLLDVIRAKGYHDAFIVNVNDNRKFTDEVVSVDNVNIRATLTGKVEYWVQLGAFKEDIPKDLAQMYLQIEGIREFKDGGFTLLLVGSYANYDEAKNKIKKLAENGMNDAFVVAFNQGKKISLQQANEYIE